jgi:hypothetical protein
VPGRGWADRYRRAARLGRAATARAGRLRDAQPSIWYGTRKPAGLMRRSLTGAAACAARAPGREAHRLSPRPARDRAREAASVMLLGHTGPAILRPGLRLGWQRAGAARGEVPDGGARDAHAFHGSPEAVRRPTPCLPPMSFRSGTAEPDWPSAEASEIGRPAIRSTPGTLAPPIGRLNGLGPRGYRRARPRTVHRRAARRSVCASATVAEPQREVDVPD